MTGTVKLPKLTLQIFLTSIKGTFPQTYRQESSFSCFYLFEAFYNQNKIAFAWNRLFVIFLGFPAIFSPVLLAQDGSIIIAILREG